MFSRNRVTHTRAERPGGISPAVHSVLAVFFFKGTSNPHHEAGGRGINISGVDFWHAVEFSRNGRFLCTHPSRRLSSGRFPSVLRFRLYQTVSDPISSVLSRFPLSRFPFRRFRLYQILSGLIPSQRGCLPGCWAVPTSETLADSRPRSSNRGLRPFERGFRISRIRTPMDATADEWLLSSGCGLRNGCPGTDRSRRSRRTTRRTLRTPPGRVNSCPGRHPAGRSSGCHDFAYVHPAVVGRLTAAVLTYALPRPPLRRPFSYLPSAEPAVGRPERRSRDQEAETMTRIFSGVKPTGHLTLGNYLGALRRWAEVDQHRADVAVLRRRSARADRGPRSGAGAPAEPAGGDAAAGGGARSGSCAPSSCRATWTSTRGCRTCWSAWPRTARCGG